MIVTAQNTESEPSTRFRRVVTGDFRMARTVLCAWLCAVSVASAEIVWFDGSRSAEPPAGKLLSDNAGYWGDSIFTGVAYHYESGPSNPPDTIGSEKGTFGRRLLDGRVAGDWNVPVGQNPGRPLVAVFDFKRPCVFSEVDTVATKTPRTSLKIEVADSPDGPWATVFERPLEKAPESALTRAILPADTRGRYLRLSVGSAGITYLDEVLVWGDGLAGADHPEHILPANSPEIPPGMLASIPGMKQTHMSVERFKEWRESLGGSAGAVWAPAAEASPSAPVLPAPEAVAPPLRVRVARNETESLYLTLTTTSATAPLEVTVEDIALTRGGKPAPHVQARLLVGGALRVNGFKRPLTAEQRMRLFLDGTTPENPQESVVSILPFFDRGQIGGNMMRRYLNNGALIAGYPRVTLPPGGSAVFMLRVTTDQAPPGRYEGVVAASTRTGDRFAVPLTVDVADLVLPELDLWVHDWSNGTDQFPFESEARRREDVRVKRESGASVWDGLPEPGSKAALFQAHGRTSYRCQGIPGKYVHDGFGNRLDPRQLNAEDRKCVADHLTALVAQTRAFGLDYDQWYAELWDEPGEKNAAAFGVLARFIRETDPKVRIYMNPLFWRPGFVPQEEILQHLRPYYNELIDLSVPISPLVGDNPTTRELWSKPRFVRALYLHPASRAGRAMAWQAFDHGFNGWGYYCYHKPRGNPWDVRTWNELGLGYQMVFPGPHGAIITPIYETMRDGWEDYRMLAALRDGGRRELVDKMLAGFHAGKPPADLRHQALEALLPVMAQPDAASSTPVTIAKEGRALLPVVIPANASESLRANAMKLAGLLGRITGGTFTVETGNGASGIVLGPQDSFPALPRHHAFDPANPARVEEYLLFTHPKGVQLTGATDLAAQNAMWDFLGRLGYRQYFPGPTWEVVPSRPSIEVNLNETVAPAYLMRSIWATYGLYPERAPLWKDWEQKNRVESGLYLSAGHSYEGILKANKVFFAAHPELLHIDKKAGFTFSEEDGFNFGTKPRLYLPEARAAFVRFYLETLRKSPGKASISVEPSDGDGWDMGPESRAFGSITDQVITLANEVAQALEKEFPEVRVCLYAYNHHAHPPAIRVHPRVTVLVATAIRRTSLPLDEQIRKWAEQGASIGIRDYHSFSYWDYDLPARAEGLPGIDGFLRTKWRPHFAMGARYYSSESQDNWGINGLLYWATARALWNPDMDISSASVLEDFLENAFGPVAGKVRPYYEILSRRPSSDPDVLHRLYRAVEESRLATGDPTILDRLDDLALYVRYLELQARHASAVGDGDGRAALEALFAHLYRSRLRSVDHARGIIRDMVRRKPLARDEEERIALGRGLPPWALDLPPYTRGEISDFISAGLRSNQPLDFEIPSFSTDLVPAIPLLADGGRGPQPSLFPSPHGTAEFLTVAAKPDTTWTFRVTNPPGAEQAARVVLKLSAAESALQEPVAAESVEVDPGKTREVRLRSPLSGIHRLVVSGRRGMEISLDSSHPWTVNVAQDSGGRSLADMRFLDLVFYVPRKTTLVAVRAGQGGRGTVLDPSGRRLAAVEDAKEGVLRIPVPAGADGAFWRVRELRGTAFHLLTVPPYLATAPENLLLPKEVVTKGSNP